MAIVIWREEYNVNVREIDEQHKTMLELVNNIHCAVEARIGKDDLVELLGQLVDFTRGHFSTEEQLMKKHDYPDLAEHHKEHRLLLQYLVDLLDAVSSGKRLTFYSDYDVSTDWALTHISEHDQDLGVFLRSKGVS
ncbi:bacteriohemerythrin [Pseudomonadota bacterium]